MSEKLQYDFTADTDDFAAGAKKVERDINKIDAAGKSATTRIGGYFKGLGNQMLGALGATAIISAFKQITQEAGKIRDGAAGVGLTIKEFQELDYIARQTGAGLGDFVNAQKAVANAQANALRGNQEMVESFTRMGVSLQELRTLSPDKLMERMGDHIKGTSDVSVILADAIKVLGGTAEKVLPAMVQGFKEMKTDAGQLGVILGDEVVHRLALISDEMTNLQLQSRGLVAELTLLFAKWGRGIGDVFDLPGKAAGGFFGVINSGDGVGLENAIDSRDLVGSARKVRDVFKDAIKAGRDAFTNEMDQRAKVEAMLKARVAASKDGRSPGSAAMAVFEQKALADLRDKVAKAERDATLSTLTKEERVNALLKERVALVEKIGKETDETTRLKLQLEQFALDKEIKGFQSKTAADEKVSKEANFFTQATINADALTRIGARRGGAENFPHGMLQKQTTILSRIEQHTETTARGMRDLTED